MTGIKISGLGKANPKKRLNNEALCQFVDSSDKWIRSRTGIAARYVVTDETVTDLAAIAAQAALTESQLLASKIDLVIVATSSPEQLMPNTACEVAKSLNITSASCFDVVAACSGFIYASEIAVAMLRAGIKQRALVIGAEALSRFLNYQDRTSSILFGDGAGAVIYESCPLDQNEILAITTGSQPEGSKWITLPVMAYDHTFYKEQKENCLQMDGRAVYCFATTKVPESIEAILRENHLKPNEIDWYVLHQANSRIMDTVAKKLMVDPNKFYKNVTEYGNTSAASIPMALYDLKDQLKQDDKIILSGFGAGLTWGNMLIQWKMNLN